MQTRVSSFARASAHTRGILFLTRRSFKYFSAQLSGSCLSPDSYTRRYSQMRSIIPNGTLSIATFSFAIVVQCTYFININLIWYNNKLLVIRQRLYFFIFIFTVHWKYWYIIILYNDYFFFLSFDIRNRYILIKYKYYT